eukprot:s192_g49.t1
MKKSRVIDLFYEVSAGSRDKNLEDHNVDTLWILVLLVQHVHLVPFGSVRQRDLLPVQPSRSQQVPAGPKAGSRRAADGNMWPLWFLDQRRPRGGVDGVVLRAFTLHQTGLVHGWTPFVSFLTSQWQCDVFHLDGVFKGSNQAVLGWLGWLGC